MSWDLLPYKVPKKAGRVSWICGVIVIVVVVVIVMAMVMVM